ncbi:MAG TPA: Trp biosynthesis-associated membrane protein [Dermatophilaceae bacterium]|nr:Trp biosynthesis-associated membrane protein [Dermatophilaceae bacterium]
MRLDKRRAAAVVLAPLSLLLGLTTQPWVTGTASDVLSTGTTEVTGGQAAPGVVGLALVAAAALLGLSTGGRIARAVSATALVLAALGSLALVGLVVADPDRAVAAEVARELARTTAPNASGSATVLGWLSLVAAALLSAGAVVAALSSRSWAGLSGRYERGDRSEAGPRGEVRTSWDELTEGGDPTLRDGPQTN